MKKFLSLILLICTYSNFYGMNNEQQEEAQFRLPLKKRKRFLEIKNVQPTPDPLQAFDAKLIELETRINKHKKLKAEIEESNPEQAKKRHQFIIKLLIAKYNVTLEKFAKMPPATQYPTASVRLKNMLKEAVLKKIEEEILSYQ